jgi:hypoxia-inducible factor (prolyl hydroxylase)
MAAVYPAAGGRYAKHVDNPNQNGRVLTAICYLNPGWRRAAGGALRVHHRPRVAATEPDDWQVVELAPLPGRLVILGFAPIIASGKGGVRGCRVHRVY